MPLRIEVFHQFCRTPDVGEQRGDRLTLAVDILNCRSLSYSNWVSGRFLSRVTEATPSEAPQSSQNLAVVELLAPHFVHRFDTGLPHSGQNVLPDVLSVPHLEQRMLVAQFVEQRLGVLQVKVVEALDDRL